MNRKGKSKSTERILLDIARTLSRQDLAFQGNESEHGGNFCQLVKLMSRYVPSPKGWIESCAGRKYKTTYLSSDSQNEFIKLLTDKCKFLIDKEIDAAPFTAVMADTTPDVSNDNQLTVAVRYVSAYGKPCECLLETKIVHDKSGAGLAKAILESAQKKERSKQILLDSKCMIVLHQCLENTKVFNKPYQS